MNKIITKSGNHVIEKLNEFEFKINVDDSKKMNVPVTIYADDNLILKMSEDRTLDQAVNVSTLPGVRKHVVVLPDGHEGYGFPVGGVAATDMEEGVISPAGVGSEGAIKLTRSELDELLIEGVDWAIEHGYGYKEDSEVCEEKGRMIGANPESVSDTARKRGSPQLGSLGSGNHFLEIQQIQEIFDENAAKVMGLEKGKITVLIHCGSRGFGHQVCSDYLRYSEKSLKKYNIELIDRELACVPNNSIEGENYRKAMYSALNFAWSNRQIITHFTRKTFEKIFSSSETGLDMKLVYDVAHNIAKVERHKVDGEGMRDLVIHRKGATRAFPAGMEQVPEKYRQIGQPVIIPGSMGTASWILVGNKKSLDLSFGSTAHGAGRTMSRGAAKRSYTIEKVKADLDSKGIYIKALTKNGIVEETPLAYKDVDSVVNVSDKLGIATKVAKLVPIGVIKG